MMTYEDYLMSEFTEEERQKIEDGTKEIIAEINQRSNNNTTKQMTHREYLASLPQYERAYIEAGTKAILAEIRKSQNGVKCNDNI